MGKAAPQGNSPKKRPWRILLDPFSHKPFAGTVVKTRSGALVSADSPSGQRELELRRRARAARRGGLQSD